MAGWTVIRILQQFSTGYDDSDRPICYHNGSPVLSGSIFTKLYCEEMRVTEFERNQKLTQSDLIPTIQTQNMILIPLI